MKLEKSLVLYKFFINLFDDKDLIGNLKGRDEGYDTIGRSYFVDSLIGLKPDWEQKLLEYDQRIKRYAEHIGKRRENFNLKYFQYLAVLFTEIFLERYFNDKNTFIAELNSFLDNFNTENRTTISPFTEENLKKLAFWLATGSGKTLIMHINYLQIMSYFDRWDNILLITPSEEMSIQHCKEMTRSGIPCKLYDGNINNLKTKNKEVLIIDIYKLTEEKKGEGKTIETSYFDGKNLVFIDEGHKGQSTEEQKWKKLREDLGKDGLIFEYSATFGQVIDKNQDLLDEYAKAIIFDYSYKYFYHDGYGKDFYVYNIKKEDYSEDNIDLLFTAGLLSFYEQLELYERCRVEFRQYNIEKPLWIFVGSKVTGKGINSDVVRVVKFLDKVTRDEVFLRTTIEKIFKGQTGLKDKNGDDIFEDKFEFLRTLEIDDIVDGIYEKVFNGRGRLQLREIKNADGEIAIRTTENEYFADIKVGDLSELKKLLKSIGFEVEEDKFTDSLFLNIDSVSSPVNILIGVKKFIEGWDSWRVSSMGLLNMGKSEGPQIIQLFGRGVRLKGKDYSLKREENAEYKLKVLQTLFIFGLNADYVDAFLGAMNNEGIDYEEIRIKIRFNKLEEWTNKLLNVKVREEFNFKNIPIKLEFNENIVKRISIDLRPRITLRHGVEERQDIVTTVQDPITISEEHLKMVDWSYVYPKLIEYKLVEKMYNLAIDPEILRDIVESTKYKIYTTSGRFDVKTYDGIRKWNELILMILKNYIQKFYKYMEKKFMMNYLTVEPLNEEKKEAFPEKGEIILRIPQGLRRDIQKVYEQLKDFDEGRMPREWEIKHQNGRCEYYFIVHLDSHLYTPLIVWQQGKDEIESIPVKLNKGETKFVLDLKKYLEENKLRLMNTKVFLLRNLSKRGVGFFVNAGFYPDFIMWLVNEDKQTCIFIDPKGITYTGSFDDDKVQFCANGIKEIEKVIGRNNLKLKAYIISVTEYDEIYKRFHGGGKPIEEFTRHNILFMEQKYELNGRIESYIGKIIFG
ncbi:DEAD/DEAH box helicase family protein [Thermoanaerobacter pentosaceus]|uniref:Helicase ATP-binding domain-containing protein n=1 Tax=Thermoanaerobacter pentosaceus TaxID=694059 RepID=A0ABT9M2K3_9THEO|nr:DEAD/DEAH box helicase family protein [Thermoanaerobacter pentosaceus]MDP9750290.1 hypothetical protein [Thermoanaerobacter pentosaceus]